MEDYRTLKDQQIAMFERHLKLMVSRRKPERRQDCAVTYSENPPDTKPEDELTDARAKQPEIVLVDTLGESIGGASKGDRDILNVPDSSDQSSGSADQGDRFSRFLQFAFMKHSFYMDLPCRILFQSEARQILTQLNGFFYLKDRRWPHMSYESWQYTVRYWNPLQKEYLNGDERAAAEDMGFILFTLWKFPVDWDFYYRALHFGDGRRKWEGTGRVA